jgi:ADP-ribosylation factor GTPase-activating protein 2/3
LGGARKPAGSKLGLGVKKLEAKVDGALFEQAPAPEAPKPAPAAAAPRGPSDSGAAAPAPTAPAPSRFAYDTITAAGAPSSSGPAAAAAPARGKDGHLTIGGLGGDDFFRDPLGRAVAPKGSGPAAFGGIGFVPVASPSAPGQRGGSSSAVETEVAQKRFANAKAISSRDFESGNGESDYDRQSRLSKFSGSSAISSDAYFDRSGGAGGSGGGGGGGGGGRRPGGGGASDLDLTAAELVNRLSFHAKQDLDQVKEMAGSAVRNISSMASKVRAGLGRVGQACAFRCWSICESSLVATCQVEPVLRGGAGTLCACGRGPCVGMQLALLQALRTCPFLTPFQHA